LGTVARELIAMVGWVPVIAKSEQRFGIGPKRSATSAQSRCCSPQLSDL
jgi:hypothetical protein